MNKITFNNTVIEIFVGDLANSEYDAIVLPTNGRLLPSGDLRCRVLRKAGPKVQIECNKIIQKISMIPFGGVVMTSGGNLPSKTIIHARTGHDAKRLMLATWNSLKTADQAKLQSIVFPALSKEVIGFNSKLCAEVMLPTIKKYIEEKNQNLKNVSICLESLPDYKEYENALNSL
ncbi:MAG: macro domain-containing protein [Promethearchaeota archaeon]